MLLIILLTNLLMLVSFIMFTTVLVHKHKALLNFNSHHFYPSLHSIYTEPIPHIALLHITPTQD